MNDLLERYLAAVCSYFIGFKKRNVYNDLKKEIQSSVNQYDDLENLLVDYGHPRCIALSYGYRSFLGHVYNPYVINIFERTIFSVSFIYLFFSTLYYLQQLNCLPFQSTHIVASTINMSSFFTWMLSNPTIIMGCIGLFSLIALFVLDRIYPMNQTHDLNWNIDKLYKLPHPSQYAYHMNEIVYMIIFTIFFILYFIFFNSTTILAIQHSSSQMIHLMSYFFQPFVMIIILDFVIDMTKRKYSKKYLMYSTIINFFTLLSLTIFVINSHLLSNYILPAYISFHYFLVDFFIIGALILIFVISLYKLIRNIKSYRSLFKK